jgi:hypothetical protein
VALAPRGAAHDAVFVRGIQIEGLGGITHRQQTVGNPADRSTVNLEPLNLVIHRLHGFSQISER